MARFILRCGCVFTTESMARDPEQKKLLKLKSGDPWAVEIGRELKEWHDANPEMCVKTRSVS